MKTKDETYGRQVHHLLPIGKIFFFFFFCSLFYLFREGNSVCLGEGKAIKRSSYRVLPPRLPGNHREDLILTRLSILLGVFFN